MLEFSGLYSANSGLSGTGSCPLLTGAASKKQIKSSPAFLFIWWIKIHACHSSTTSLLRKILKIVYVLILIYDIYNVECPSVYAKNKCILQNKKAFYKFIDVFCKK